MHSGGKGGASDGLDRKLKTTNNGSLKNIDVQKVQRRRRRGCNQGQRRGKGDSPWVEVVSFRSVSVGFGRRAEVFIRVVISSREGTLVQPSAVMSSTETGEEGGGGKKEKSLWALLRRQRRRGCGSVRVPSGRVPGINGRRKGG